MIFRRRTVIQTLAAIASLAIADLAFPPPVPPADSGLVVTAADGTPLRAYPGSDGVWRYPVTPDAVSPLYLEALLAYEDRWFYWHPGVNPYALARAAWQWARHGEIVSGGSTLTMQAARMLDPGARNVRGKLKQIVRALQLERRYSKREILTLYLNHAPMGGIVQGVEMASRVYLGKSASHLTHAEAALLTALPQAPSRLRPDREAAAAESARNKVLDRLATSGRWNGALVADAKIERVATQAIRGRWLAPLAAERLRQHARSGPRDARPAAVQVVRSTLDPELQALVENMLLDRTGVLPPRVSIAVLVMENSTLAVRAYAGSADFSDAQRYAHVDMVRGVRSPGSALKPFLYALALDDGLIHSESLLIDAPQSFGGYQPGNFQAAFSGPVSASEALQRSLNVPAVDLLDRVGPARFAATLRAAGLRLRMERGSTPNLSLILGGGGTTLEELVGAYRALAAGGISGKPRLAPGESKVESRIMSEGAAFIVRDILEAGGHPERPFHEALARPVAWKTGTSFGFRDAWAVGVTDAHTIGVWIGRPDGTPNPGFFGANVAAPLLKDIVAALPISPETAPRTRPADVTAVTVCWPTGEDARRVSPELCHVKRAAWALAGGVPPTLPDRMRAGGLREAAWIDPASGYRVTPDCAPGALPREIARWPVHLEPWLDTSLLRHHAAWRWKPGCVADSAPGAGLRIAGLESGAVLRPAPQSHRIAVSLSAVGGTQRVYWLVDGRYSQVTRGTAPVRVVFTDNGTHAITAFDADGRHHRIEIVVKGLPPPA
jgi:penicillin-binding protein 1C